jgi:hypothetical protein
LFRAINVHLEEGTLYTCSIWYRHSLRAVVVADRYTDWVRNPQSKFLPQWYIYKHKYAKCVGMCLAVNS